MIERQRARRSWLLGTLTAGLLIAAAGGAAADGDLAKLPVKEVTIFKDGHAFVLREGAVATDKAGDVILGDLPTPVMGTFWPHSRDKRAKLKTVVSGSQKHKTETAARSLADLLKANAGQEATITDADNREIKGVIVQCESGMVLVRNDRGVRAMSVSRVRDVTLPNKFKGKVEREGTRHVLTYDLEWAKGKPAKTADVGMVYLQKGIRWIPNYRIDVDGEGKAKVRLQATLVNDMVDLDGVTLHLVIGVPTILFADKIDPISFQKNVASLSRSLRPDVATAQYFSNAIRTQVPVSNAVRRQPTGGAGAVGDAVTGSAGREDLYVFTLEDMTLAKGKRMVVQVAEFELPYEDVYTLDIAISPPPDVWRHFSSSQRQSYMRQFHVPKAIHKVRLTNRSKVPITTAPALILSGGRLIAQGMTRYTPSGGQCDVSLTTAVNVGVRKTDKEAKRTANAKVWNGNQYSRSDLAGEIELVNHTDEPIVLEVTRSALGMIDSAGQGGTAVQINTMEDPTFVPSGGVGRPAWSNVYWWHWYSWPSWWTHLNGAGRVTWNLTLKPGEKTKLTYTWHYFWR